MLAAGFDAIVNERANRMRWPRGPRRYDLAILVELARLRPRRYTLRLDGGDARRWTRCWWRWATAPATAAACGSARTPTPPTACWTWWSAGRFDRRTLMRVKPRIYQGTHVNHPLVRSYRARTVELAAEGITTYADGERPSTCR